MTLHDMSIRIRVLRMILHDTIITKKVLREAKKRDCPNEGLFMYKGITYYIDYDGYIERANIVSAKGDRKTLKKLTGIVRLGQTFNSEEEANRALEEE